MPILLCNVNATLVQQNVEGFETLKCLNLVGDNLSLEAALEQLVFCFESLCEAEV